MARILKGKVVSDKADKTVVVRVDTSKTHPLYHKSYTVYKRYQAHDEKNESKVGDLVEITEGRPISKQKDLRSQKLLQRLRNRLK